MSYRTCVKCGATTDQKPTYSSDGSFGFQRIAWGECLVRRCSRCGYTYSDPIVTPPAAPEGT